MPYWTLLYHIVWATKDRQPLLVGEVETRILGLIRAKASNLGITVHALNGMRDHVHLVASIPPTLALSKAIGQIKGVATAVYNKERSEEDPAIYWQAEYGAFTLDRKTLPA
ncbi:MAG TPA: IS200/IS605 family transposase, partial [Miltoncostaeaceae bacterium]|nr:IS200/IS605 family transposase [Miltoncostaeaceae bacterium]